MEWKDDALILGSRKHGETSIILEVMTREKGRYLGLVRGGRSKRMQPALQIGNRVRVHWRARLEEHLGIFTVDPLEMRAASLMDNRRGLQTMQTLAGLLRLLPERDPHAGLADAAEVILGNLEDPTILAVLLVRFELALLEDLGFGLDLNECAGTGTTKDLIYVSPKSGRAVSAEAGKPYHDKMLALPTFVRGGSEIKQNDIADAFRLTGFFLERHIFGPRGVKEPIERSALLKELTTS